MIKKAVVLLGPVLSRGGGRAGLTHTDGTTRGNAPREREARKYVSSTGNERWEKQPCQKSSESQHYIRTLDPSCFNRTELREEKWIRVKLR